MLNEEDFATPEAYQSYLREIQLFMDTIDDLLVRVKAKDAKDDTVPPMRSVG